MTYGETLMERDARMKTNVMLFFVSVFTGSV
jgi:hypothetical protein